MTTCVVGVTAGCMLCGWLSYHKIRKCAFAKVEDRATGEQRRRAVPPHIDVSADDAMPGMFELEVATNKPVDNQRAFLTLKNGQNIFYQTWAPSHSSFKATSAIIIIHGFGDHSDFFNALKAKTLCNMGDFVVAAFDLPGHGRSDGTSICVTDWFEFVDQSREVIVEHLVPMMRKRWGNLKFFGVGESMGGGMLFTMLSREKELFDGVVLICPMLFVSRDLFPPWIVVQIFKYILMPTLPEWPIAPNKDMFDFLYSDPKVKNYLRTELKHHSKIENKAPPRLCTAWQLAFVAGEWMLSKLHEFDTPALIIHGGADSVTDPNISKELYEKMKNPDKTFLHPEGVWHGDLFHGGPSMREEMKGRYEELVTWLKKRS